VGARFCDTSVGRDCISSIEAITTRKQHPIVFLWDKLIYRLKEEGNLLLSHFYKHQGLKFNYL